MKLPVPTERLADCVWLPRIIAKARLAHAGQLEPDYAARFCHPSGVDGQFVGFFNLTKEDLLSAGTGNDAGVSAWFTALPTATPAKIQA